MNHTTQHIIDGPKILFIGGTRDGDRLPDTGKLQVELPLPGAKPARKGAPVPTEIYTRSQLTGETEAFQFYVLRGVSGNSAVRALIENYPARQPAERKA